MRPMSKGDNSDDSHKYSVDVPHELSSIGAVYVYVVQATDDEALHPHFEVNKSNAVAGPRVWMFGFDSEGKPDNGYELFSGSRTAALVNCDTYVVSNMTGGFRTHLYRLLQCP
ncbi:hypothetical protein CC2G_015066 [Coprinopsis cinerea AmutBmut pab1-1]|nr:hypothetical protein CC2G_015066 [Coprinopsis cinerea AmutBmut pab1-1]